MSQNTVRTFAILLSRRAEVEAALVRLNKKATRKSLPLLAWAWGKGYVEEGARARRRDGASVIVAYQRFIGKERARAERAARPKLDVFLGTVGEKLTFGLPLQVGEKLTFGLPLQVGKKGKPLKNAPTVASLEPVTLDFVTGYETDFGYTTVLKFRTAEGATIVWKASNTEISRDDVGKRYTVWGTVKAHTEYKGEKQTMLTRCAVNEIKVSEAESGAGVERLRGLRGRER